MIEFNLKQMQSMFFDRSAVIRATGRATRRVLSRFGAFVRTRAKQSIRTKDGVSAPGKPPYSHTGLLRNFIFFAYDAHTQSVVIGPAKLNNRSNAPEVLEHGGIANIPHKRLYIEPRPYMEPAFEIELHQMPPLWHNSIT